MKKVLSIVIAVAFIFAICVPVFAADDVTGPADSATTETSTPQVNVKTLTEDINGKDPSTYTVYIPADITVAWGDTSAHEAAYTVDTQLKIGATVAVSAAADNSGTMTANGTTDTLTFALSNGNQTTFEASETGAAPATQPSVAIADFSGAAIAEYTGTVTFTVVYTPAA